MMTKNYDQLVEINHNLNWPYVPDHLYRILIFGGLGSRKSKALLKLTKNQQPDTAKFTYMSKIYSNQSVICLLTLIYVGFLGFCFVVGGSKT